MAMAGLNQISCFIWSPSHYALPKCQNVKPDPLAHPLLWVSKRRNSRKVREYARGPSRPRKSAPAPSRNCSRNISAKNSRLPGAASVIGKTSRSVEKILASDKGR
jgi:hypothetical protein